MNLEKIISDPDRDTAVYMSEDKDWHRYIEIYADMAVESHLVSCWSKGNSTWTIWRDPKKIQLIKNGIIPKWDETTWDKPNPVPMQRCKVGNYVLKGTLTQGCKALAQKGLLKGHTLLNSDGKTIEIGKATWCSKKELPENKYTDDRDHLICVFSESEAYWQPEYVEVFYNTETQNYEFWIMPRNRHGYKITTGLNFQQAWNRAKSWTKSMMPKDYQMEWKSWI